MGNADEPAECVEWVDDADEVITVVARARKRAENLLHRSVAVIVTTSDEFGVLCSGARFVPGSAALLLPHVDGFTAEAAGRHDPGTTPTM